MDYDKLADYFSHKGYKTVALITTTFPPYPNEARSSSVGGATMDLIYTVDFLTKRGFKVSVLALDFRGSVKKTGSSQVSSELRKLCPIFIWGAFQWFYICCQRTCGSSSVLPIT